MSTHESGVPIFGLEHTAAIVAAYVSNPQHHVPSNELASLVRNVHGTVTSLGTGAEPDHAAQKPAVPVKKSVASEHIICLEDGKKLKMLKRYLRTNYNLTPDEYRAKWGLPHDYPMVAPAYAAQRSEFAKKIGLGKNAPKNRGRRR